MGYRRVFSSSQSPRLVLNGVLATLGSAYEKHRGYPRETERSDRSYDYYSQNSLKNDSWKRMNQRCL